MSLAAHQQNIVAIGRAIKALGSIPSGHLYARLISKMSIDTYLGYIDILERAGVIQVDSSHLIHYIEKPQNKQE